MNKKIINLILTSIILLLFATITFAYTVNMDFWQESRLQPSHDDGYEYIPNASQFIENGCGTKTVLDKEHRLCWDANGTRFATSNWSQAQSDCSGLDLGGRTDWRLPTINELLTLVRDEEGTTSGDHLNNLGVGFGTYQNGYYWAGDILASNPSGAWRVPLGSGGVYSSVVTAGNGVVCVSRY